MMETFAKRLSDAAGLVFARVEPTVSATFEVAAHLHGLTKELQLLGYPLHLQTPEGEAIDSNDHLKDILRRQTVNLRESGGKKPETYSQFDLMNDRGQKVGIFLVDSRAQMSGPYILKTEIQVLDNKDRILAEIDGAALLAKTDLRLLMADLAGGQCQYYPQAKGFDTFYPPAPLIVGAYVLERLQNFRR